MALNIKDTETDRLARELARETGETITVAVRRAIEERLARVRARHSSRRSESDLYDIIKRGRQRVVLDARSAEEIVGYDERGLPS
ncbi:MAG: type II toxin-antitoxin system VapB family antitoxin [Dermatophilaceae bacterium]